MDANAKLWTSALRSGTYRQTRGRLRERSRLPWRPSAFCAVGMLYHIYLEAHGQSWPAEPLGGQLPQAVLDWAGVPRQLESHVIAHNDGGRSFEEIASIIEAYFHRANRQRLWEESRRIADRSIEQARRGSAPIAM